MYPNLKLQIWKSGIRQQQLARSLGLHESVLSKIVNGARIPSDSLKERIAAALNADESWLFEPSVKAGGTGQTSLKSNVPGSETPGRGTAGHNR